MKFITMSRLIIFGILTLALWSCASSHKATKTTVSLDADSTDSTEYQILIDDPGFEQWYIIQYSQAKDHSNEYYNTFNLRGVSNWNEYFRTGRHDNVVGCIIEYWPNIDYGIEVNRKLFWYFKYVEENFGIRLFR